jgi:hypothetical protein
MKEEELAAAAAENRRKRKLYSMHLIKVFCECVFCSKVVSKGSLSLAFLFAQLLFNATFLLVFPLSSSSSPTVSGLPPFFLWHCATFQ